MALITRFWGSGPPPPSQKFPDFVCFGGGQIKVFVVFFLQKIGQKWPIFGQKLTKFAHLMVQNWLFFVHHFFLRKSHFWCCFGHKSGHFRSGPAGGKMCISYMARLGGEGAVRFSAFYYHRRFAFFNIGAILKIV